jgi:hypothetical protein
MAADADIAKFTEAIGATEPQPGDELYAGFRKMFKRSNYFLLDGRFLIVKISRSKNPFWGVGKEVIDFLNALNNYYLVLLVPGSEGWVFSKAEVNINVRNKKWNLGDDGDYKINPPLPDANTFAGPKTFRKKVGVGEP